MRQSPRVCPDGSVRVLNIEFKGVFVVVACLVCSQAPTCTRSEEPTAMISDGLRLLPSYRAACKSLGKTSRENN